MIAWSAIEASLIRMNRRASPHKLSPWLPVSSRRAAVAVVLWGSATEAKDVILIQRGFTAPQHAGELAFPGGMVEPFDRDLRATARRELDEEIGLSDGLWELGCLPDGVAKGRTRFTPVVFRWEMPEPRLELGPEVRGVLRLDLEALLEAPWEWERLEHGGIPVDVPRLELPGVPLWGATALVLKAWLDVLRNVLEEERIG